jgi:hypothetical protein
MTAATEAAAAVAEAAVTDRRLTDSMIRKRGGAPVPLPINSRLFAVREATVALLV